MRDDARAPVAEPAVDDWWTDVEDDVLRCFDGGGALPPSEIAATLGISEAAATSLLVLMAQEGKVRICLVASGGGRGRGR